MIFILKNPQYSLTVFYIIIIFACFCNKNESHIAEIETSFYFQLGSKESNWIPFFARTSESLTSEYAQKKHSASLRPIVETLDLPLLLVPQLNFINDQLIFADLPYYRILVLDPISVPNGLGILKKVREISIKEYAELMGFVSFDINGNIYVEVFESMDHELKPFTAIDLARHRGRLPETTHGRLKHQLLVFNEYDELKMRINRRGVNTDDFFGPGEEITYITTDENGNVFVNIRNRNWDNVLKESGAVWDKRTIYGYSSLGDLHFEWEPERHEELQSNDKFSKIIEELTLSPGGKYIAVVVKHLPKTNLGNTLEKRFIYIFNRRDSILEEQPIPIDNSEFWGINQDGLIFLRMPIPPIVYKKDESLKNGFRVISKSLTGDTIADKQVKVQEVGAHRNNFLLNNHTQALFLKIQQRKVIGMIYNFNINKD